MARWPKKRIIGALLILVGICLIVGNLVYIRPYRECVVEMDGAFDVDKLQNAAKSISDYYGDPVKKQIDLKSDIVLKILGEEETQKISDYQAAGRPKAENEGESPLSMSSGLSTRLMLIGGYLTYLAVAAAMVFVGVVLLALSFLRGDKGDDLLRRYTMVLALVAVTIFFFIGTDGTILVPQNINNLISQNAYVFVLAAGMLCCILTGGNIDLSVGSVVCFTGAVGASLLKLGWNMWLVIGIMLLTGLAIGAFQGFWVAWVRVPPFIATLAGMYAFRGLSNVVLGGYAVDITNTAFLDACGGGSTCYIADFLNGKSLDLTCMVVGIVCAGLYMLMSLRKIFIQKRMGIIKSVTADLAKSVLLTVLVVWLFWKLASYQGIPTVLIWIALVLLVYNYVTNSTTIGRHLYAVGGNEKATRLSGVNTRFVYFFAYANMGMLAGLAGILTVARLVSSQPTYGQGYEMDAIASCFIGGASAYGGTGKISGVIIGAVLMGLINQGMIIMNVDVNYHNVVKGIVLLLAVIFDVLSKRQKR